MDKTDLLFVDANIFLRHFTREDPDKAQACFQLFESAQRNEIALTTTESIIAEVVYVLSSKRLYARSPAEIRNLLYPVLSLQGFKLVNRKLYLRALDIYAESGLDFEDALAVVHMENQGSTRIYSYDQHFDRIRNIQRIEP